MDFEKDFDHFEARMKALCLLYGKEPNADFLQIYWNSLNIFTFTEFDNALTKYVRFSENGQFMPKPADIIKFIHGSLDCQAFRAWDKFLKALKRYGHYDSLIFSDLKINQVIHDMGGLSAMSSKTEKELEFKSKEFETRYRSYMLNEINEDNYVPKLIGVIESQNLLLGYSNYIPSPVYIECDEKSLNDANYINKQTNLLT